MYVDDWKLYSCVYKSESRSNELFEQSVLFLPLGAAWSFAISKARRITSRANINSQNKKRIDKQKNKRNNEKR